MSSEASVPRQFHMLSFEGPDCMRAAGGVATRVVGLAEALASRGFDTHLWFVGDPAAPGSRAARSTDPSPLVPVDQSPRASRGVSETRRKGTRFAASLPPILVREVLLPPSEGWRPRR